MFWRSTIATVRPWHPPAHGGVGIKKRKRADGAFIEYLLELKRPAPASSATIEPEAPDASPVTLQVLNFGDKRIRLHVDEKGEPWFCANDVTDALGYKNGPKAVSDHVDADERAAITIRYGSSNGVEQNRQVTFIKESGVYNLASRSKLPGAEAWWKRIRTEVLPTIRKTGIYIAPELAANNLAILPTPEALTAAIQEAMGPVIQTAIARFGEQRYEAGQEAAQQLVNELDEQLAAERLDAALMRTIASDELSRVCRAGLAVAGRIKDGDPEPKDLPNDWRGAKTPNPLDIHDVAIGLGFKLKREAMAYFESKGWVANVPRYIGRDANFQAEMDLEPRWSETLHKKGFTALTADTICSVKGRGRAFLEGQLYFVRHHYDLRGEAECRQIKGMICGGKHAGELEDLRAAYEENRAPNSTKFSHPIPKRLKKPDAAE